jgi:cytoskeletal protein CcmA (bactofilin family)
LPASGGLSNTNVCTVMTPLWSLDMWKRDEAVKPPNGQPFTPAAPTYPPVAGQDSQRPNGRDIANIGKSVVIKGELNGSEDLAVEGNVEGTIELRDNVLTVGVNGHVKAKVFAKAVIVLGTVTGDITASERVDIRDGGSVEGDVVSPRVAIAEGAHFRGSIDMQGGKRVLAGSRASAPERDEPSHSFGVTGEEHDRPMAAAATY